MIINENGVEKMWIEDISYGGYSLDKITFNFYRDKLFKVDMKVHTDKEETYFQSWTYNNLSHMLDKKYKYKRAEKEYDNEVIFSDQHTEASLYHSPNISKDYEESLTYYDKDSRYKEYQEKGF